MEPSEKSSFFSKQCAFDQASAYWVKDSIEVKNLSGKASHLDCLIRMFILEKGWERYLIRQAELDRIKIQRIILY